MSNLATVPPAAMAKSSPFEPSSINEAMQLSDLLSRSALVPGPLRGKPADIFIILATARELGIGPMQALSDINVIQGKPVYSADLMVAQCKRRPDICKYFRLIESTNEKATYETLRAGAPHPETLTFTIEDAKRLGLAGKDNWQKQPKTMLRRRCAAQLARETYQDLVRGYDPDEAEDFGAQTPDPAQAPALEPAKPVETVTETIKAKVAEKLGRPAPSAAASTGNFRCRHGEKHPNAKSAKECQGHTSQPELPQNVQDAVEILGGEVEQLEGEEDPA